MKSFIFDFDGTLVDSMPHWGRKMVGILERRGIPYPPDLIKTVTPLGDLGTANYFVEHFRIPMSVTGLIAEMNDYALPLYRDHIPAKEGVVETLLYLKQRGYSLNILTASPHLMLDPCLRRLGIFDLFDNVWSCDDFSTTKSDPDIYARAARRLHTTVENCVFVDDNYHALATAKRAGMEVAGIYDESSADDREGMISLCGKYLERFSDLITMLEEQL